MVAGAPARRCVPQRLALTGRGLRTIPGAHRPAQPVLHAVVLATGELARSQALAAEEAYRRGTAGPLAGVPVSIKDAFHMEGHVTTLGSLAHADVVMPHDSGAVRRLRRAGRSSSARPTCRSSANRPPPTTCWAPTRRIRSTSVAPPVVPAAVLHPRSPRACARSVSGRTAAARSAFLHRSAASWASSPATELSTTRQGSERSARSSLPAPWRGASPTPAACMRCSPTATVPEMPPAVRNRAASHGAPRLRGARSMPASALWRLPRCRCSRHAGTTCIRWILISAAGGDLRPAGAGRRGRAPRPPAGRPP